jgi:hypothetical protein
MPDVKVWAAVLLVQSVPYFASLLMSLISAMPRLPARLIGPLQEMRDQEPTPRQSARTTEPRKAEADTAARTREAPDQLP